MKKEYYILTNVMRQVEATGPFSSIENAEAHILEDCREHFTPEDVSCIGEDPDWGMDHVIVAVVKTVKPVPRLSLSVSLQTVKPAKGPQP